MENVKKEFSYRTAEHFAELSNLAYQEEKQFKKTASAMGYKNIKYFNVDGAQAYGMAKDDYIVLAFRGTEPTQFNDIKADLNALHVRNELGKGRVHKGFKREVDDIWEQIEDWLAKRNWRQAYTCGHSLGGAMSTIACSRLPEGTICYNYGSPRVGTPGWVKEFNSKFKLHRFVNNNDIVPRVPFAFMWYKHAGELHYINTYGKIRNASAWQRIKDRFRGYRAAFRKRQWFDSIYDHGMPNYVERIKKQKDGMIIL